MDDTKVTTEEVISWLEKRLEQRPTPGESCVFYGSFIYANSAEKEARRMDQR